MVFSSLLFLCAFLPVVLMLYLICPGKLRNLLLFVTSLFFYAWGEPKYILILLFSTVFDYVNGRLIAYFDTAQKKKAKKMVLVVSIVGNLLILFTFKYLDLMIQTVNVLTSSSIDLLYLVLPIGISFYTFQTMSYTIDVYRGEVRAQHNIISFGMYVSMFPQLIAGPIVRYRQIEDQMNDRHVTSQAWVEGMQRFLIGLGKKVLLANQIGTLWDEISGAGSMTMAGAWLGAFAYTFQIYFDFSGYSDMAIGLGKLFGFSFPENFDHPYESKNITEFWRRWHMTLGTWFREYVYIPLGGNRLGLPRQIFNLFVVWFLTGFWHGASWNFALWGIYFFVLLCIEKLFLLKEMERWPKILQHLYGKFFIVVGWVIFANEDFSKMGRQLRAMFGMSGALYDQTAIYQWSTYAGLLVILCIASVRLPAYLMKKIRRYLLRTETEFAVKKGKKVEAFCYGVYTIIVLLLSMSMLVSGSYNPFLYFRF